MRQAYISPDIQLVKVNSTAMMAGSNTFDENGNSINITPGSMNTGDQKTFRSAQYRWFEEEGEI